MTESEEARNAEKRHRIQYATDELEAVFDYAMTQGWGDGLPLIPPTEERVAAMLSQTSRKPDDVIATVAPAYGIATVQKVAVNAVMAGCKPEYLEVVITAVEACADPAFNLYSIQSTTNPATPMILVNGPIRSQLQFNSGGNALGQGSRPNATIGRALRLILVNIGGARVGEVDLATQGFPGKYTLCCAENEELNPWEPHHETKGLDKSQSAVTVFGVQALHSIVAIGVRAGRDIMRTIGMGMAVVGTNNVTYGGQALVILSPEHAAAIAAEGFSKADARHFLYEHSRLSLRGLPIESQAIIFGRRSKWLNDGNVTVADSPDEVELVVVGGPGNHSVFAPSFGATRSVTRPIQRYS